MVRTHSTIMAPHRPGHLGQGSPQRSPGSRLQPQDPRGTQRPRAWLMGEKPQAADSRVQVSIGRATPGPAPGAAQNASRIALSAGDPFGELRARGMLNAQMDPGAAEKVRRASTRRLPAPFQVRGAGATLDPLVPTPLPPLVRAARRLAKPLPFAVFPVATAHVRSQNRPRITVGVSSKRVFLTRTYTPPPS